MSRHRRHANDFTDSLNSFHYTRSEFDSNTFCSISHDSLDECEARSNCRSNDTTRSTKHSTILAGSSTKDSLEQNTFTTTTSSDTPSLPLQSVPDLNKRIDLFQSKHLKEKYQHNVDLSHSCMKVGDDKENNNPQYTIKDKQSENYGVPKKLTNEFTIPKERLLPLYTESETNTSEDSKRDTNYNIHSDTNIVSEENVLKSISELLNASVLKYTGEDTQISKTNNENDPADKESKKFETVLCCLDNHLNSIREVKEPQQILKRLSDIYTYSPKNFTEKLLTIIEESIVNNDNETCTTSALNLSRLTTEFRKMCKFIEDESPPEWPASPMSTPEQAVKSPTQNRSASIKVSKSEKLFTSPMSATCLPGTPLSAIDILRKRLFSKMSKNNSNRGIDNVLNLSVNDSNNASFERLEFQCRRLFPEEKQCSQSLRRSMSVPSLLSMSQIENICEKQMASLNVSTTNEENQKEKVSSTPNLLNKYLCDITPQSSCPKVQESHHKTKTFQYDNVSYSKKKSIRINVQPEINNVETNKATNDYTTFDPDELEKTLLQDIAEKRKRCLDTARLLAEIDADHEAIEAKKSLRMSPASPTDSELNSLSNSEGKFLKTLMSCKDYQTYLEKKKPLFNLLQKSNTSCIPKSPLKDSLKNDSQYEDVKDSGKKTLSIKKSPGVRDTFLSQNMKSNNMHKSPLSNKKANKCKKETENVKPKLFVTPGKNRSTECSQRKKIYFPNMHSPKKSGKGLSPGPTVDKHILKSPNAEGLYRLNYNTIMSPVGMYIRGTDMKLIKNVRPKTGGSLFIPIKKTVKPSPNRKSRQATPSPSRISKQAISSKSITRSQEKLPLKINLSPKVRMNQGCNAEANMAKTAKTPENYNTPKSHFELPRVSYKLPLQVKTLKENTPSKSGNRVKKLLESAQSKVVIRHEGRINSTQKGDRIGTAANDEVFEINYEPEDESIHVEQAASKTNFIHRTKYI